MTNPRKRTLNKAEESGSLALTTDTTSGETSDTAFIDRKKAKAVPKRQSSDKSAHLPDPLENLSDK